MRRNLFKPFRIGVLLLCAAFLVGCDGNGQVVDPADSTDSDVQVEENQPEVVIPTESGLVAHGFYPSTDKVGQDVELAGQSTGEIYLAKNEFEGCHLVLRASEDISVTVEASTFTAADGSELVADIFAEEYIACVSDADYGTYPDALIPVTDAGVSLSAGKNLPLYIRLRTKADTSAGEYVGNVTVKNASDGSILFRTEVKAKVWDFTLSEEPSCKTAFGIHTTSVFSKYPAETAVTAYYQYYDYLLDHKITPYWMNAAVLSDEGSVQMSDPRRTSFIIPYYGDDADASAQFEKIKTNSDWLEKSFFYVVDEPGTAEAYSEIRSLGQKLRKLCPGYNMITPFNSATVTVRKQKTSTVDLLEGNSNILCPLSSLFSDKSFVERIDQAKADGSRIWWYVCSAPGDKYCNFLIQQEGIRPRMLFWQQKERDIEGFLYWETAYWVETENPWTNPLTTPGTGSTSFGDGSLFYPGEDCPISTIRLELITDGIEDYEYLTMAEELLGSEYVDETIAKVTKSLTNYTKDSALFAEVRKALGNDIEAATKGQ